MEKEIFNHQSPLMYCPHCAEIISRKAIDCPKCHQKIMKESRWPMVGIVLGGVISVLIIAGVISAISIPAYQAYVKQSEETQLEQNTGSIEEEENE